MYISDQVITATVALVKAAIMPKKKGGKMGNMTEEERLLFLEQQRLAEEEMQKNKEDMLAQFLKVCLYFLATCRRRVPKGLRFCPVLFSFFIGGCHANNVRY